MSDIGLDQSVFQAFSSVAARYGNRPFLNVVEETADIYGIDAGELTYATAACEVERLRHAYQTAGYTAGDRVLLLLENRPAFFLHWFALNALGSSVVPVNPDLRAAELEYIAGHSEPALAVAIDSRNADLTRAGAASGKPYPVVGPEQEPPPRQHPVEAPNSGVEVLPQCEAAMLYTSGTTGTPKGCVLSNRYFLHAGAWYAKAGGLCELSRDGERMITPLPLFHMNAMACSAMAMLAVGGCLTVLDRFHPGSWWGSVRESKATSLHYLGVMPTLLMAAPPAADDAALGETVRFGFGAGVDRQLHQPFEQRFGFPLVEAWAMTETGAGAVIAANGATRKIGNGCFGRPDADVETRIVGDDGAEVVSQQPGELLVRHSGADPRFGFFTEYYKDQKATAEAWQGGWFHTGDIVTRDNDGDMVFVDRKKNVIRRSGENIAAVEVESALMRHPSVQAAAVAAVPDPLRGDEVCACIVAQQPPVDQPERDALARDIVTWCLQQLAYYKAPGYVAFVDELPLTATQKLQRGALKMLAAQRPAHPQTVDTRAMKKRQSR